MDIEERQRRIADMVAAEGRVKAVSLSEAFDVSVETIRKDLLDLQEAGVLVRVHGGAQARRVERESAYQRRRSVHTEAKAAIADLALQRIEDGSTIYLDYGTTTYALASALVREGRTLTVITNALPIASMLAESEGIEIVVLGGIFRRNEWSLYGPLAEQAWESLYVDAGFFGAAGLHPEAGMTNHHPFEVAVSQKALARCRTAVALADESKLDSIAVHKVAPLSGLDLLITDARPGPELTEALEDHGVEISIAKETHDALQ